MARIKALSGITPRCLDNLRKLTRHMLPPLLVTAKSQYREGNRLNIHHLHLEPQNRTGQKLLVHTRNEGLRRKEVSSVRKDRCVDRKGAHRDPWRLGPKCQARILVSRACSDFSSLGRWYCFVLGLWHRHATLVGSSRGYDWEVCINKWNIHHTNSSAGLCEQGWALRQTF